MLQICLMRHAKAEPARPGVDDHDRALAPRGWSDIQRVAQVLVAGGLSPALVQHSDARRCVETWKAIRDLFPGADCEERSDLYLADAETLLRSAEASGAPSVLVIAHNPGLHDLACRLAPLGSGPAREMRLNFPTGAAAAFRRETPTGEWRLEDFLTPRSLRPD